METFDNDYNYIFKKLGLIQKELKSRNVNTNKKPYQEYYSIVDIAKNVAHIYQKDIQLFGHQY